MVGTGVVAVCLLHLSVWAVNPDQFCELTEATAIPLEWYCPSDLLANDEMRGIHPVAAGATDAFVNIPTAKGYVGYIYLKVKSGEDRAGDEMNLIAPRVQYEVYVNRHPIDMVAVACDAQRVEVAPSANQEEAHAERVGWIRSARPYVLNPQSILSIRCQMPDWSVAGISISPLVFSESWNETTYAEAQERLTQGDSTLQAGIPTWRDSLESWQGVSSSGSSECVEEAVERARPYIPREEWSQDADRAAAMDVESDKDKAVDSD
jgi:hypothetical protein